MCTSHYYSRAWPSSYIAFFVLSLGKLILIWFEFEENVANENLERTFFRM